MKTKWRAIECFSCSGGMAEGFRRAGITFDFVFDFSADAVESYEKNLGHRPVQMDVRDLVRLARGGWRPGEQLDLIVADPPCTPWSRAGKRLGTEDERDMLRETCELIRLLKPRAYLIGNVPGLDDATQWHNVQHALAPLRKAGYCIADYASFDAANYGVPQHRVRPFWFGHLEGPCIAWPMPTHGALEYSLNHSLPGTELAPWVTCRAALQHLPLEDLGRPVRLRWKPVDPAKGGHRPSGADEPAKTLTLTRNANGDGSLLVNGRHAPSTPEAPAPSTPEAPAPAVAAKIRGQSAQVLDVSSITGGRAKKATPGEPAPTITGGGTAAHGPPMAILDLGEPHPRHPITRPDEPAFVVRTNGGRASQAGSMLDFREASVRPHHRVDSKQPARTLTASRQDDARILDWPWARPSTTVTTRSAIPPPGHHPESGSILSQPNAVVLSERAAAILQGFPESWVFVGATKTSRWSQLGQAMPPGLAEPVARSVVQQLERSRKARRRRA